MLEKIGILYHFSGKDQSIVYAEGIRKVHIPFVQTVEQVLCAAVAVKYDFDFYEDHGGLNLLCRRARGKYPIGFTTLPDVLGLAFAPEARFDSPFDYPAHLRKKLEAVLRFYEEMLDVLFNQPLTFFSVKEKGNGFSGPVIAAPASILTATSQQATLAILSAVLKRMEKGIYGKKKLTEKTWQYLHQYYKEPPLKLADLPKKTET